MNVDSCTYWKGQRESSQVLNAPLNILNCTFISRYKPTSIQCHWMKEKTQMLSCLFGSAHDDDAPDTTRGIERQRLRPVVHAVTTTTPASTWARLSHGKHTGSLTEKWMWQWRPAGGADGKCPSIAAAWNDFMLSSLNVPLWAAGSGGHINTETRVLWASLLV